MEKRGIFLNIIVYNMLMDVYNKFNYIEEVEGFFIEMRGKGLKFIFVIYNIFMDVYVRRM